MAAESVYTGGRDCALDDRATTVDRTSRLTARAHRTAQTVT
jgi:hypothetical protein